MTPAHDDESDARLEAASLPPPLARVAALGPAVLGLLLAYFGFFLHGAMGGHHSTLANVYFAWTFLLGATLLLAAPSIAKARVAAVVVGGVLSFFGTASSVALLARGAFAGAFGVALGLASIVVLALALPGCLRVARARRELGVRHPEVLLARRDGRSDLLGILVAFAALAVLGGAFAWCSRMPTTAARSFTASAFGQALDEPLTGYVTAIGHQGRAAKVAEARRELLSKDVERELGREGFQKLGDVLDAARVYAVVSGDDPALAQKSFWSALDGLDAQLESHGVPGFVGGYSTGAGDSRAVWVLGYFARSRASVLVGDGPPMRVVWGKRIDSLNLTDSAAALDGMSEWAIISLDALEEEFLANELPAMVRDAPMHLVQGEAAEQGPAADLGRRAASLIGDEIVRGSRLSREDAVAIDGLLAQRAANEQVLVAKGLTLRSRQRLRFTASAARSLRRYDDFVITQLLKGDEALADYEDAVASAVDLLAADEEATFMPRVAGGKPGDDRTRQIMGGQLTALARSSQAPRLTLWRAAQQAARGAYGRRAGLTLFEALFRELGVADGLDGFGDPFATALLRALEKDAGDVRAAAGRAYASLLGHEPPVVVRTMLR
jgi:hypothetical protein